MTQIQFNNEAAHGLGECPGCGAAIHVVASEGEKKLRWCCLQCMTVGSAPFDLGAEDAADDDDESYISLH